MITSMAIIGNGLIGFMTAPYGRHPSESWGLAETRST